MLFMVYAIETGQVASETSFLLRLMKSTDVVVVSMSKLTEVYAFESSLGIAETPTVKTKERGTARYSSRVRGHGTPEVTRRAGGRRERSLGVSVLLVRQAPLKGGARERHGIPRY